MSKLHPEASDWHVAVNGVHNPYFVTRYVPGDGSDYVRTAKGNVRRFKTREAAQKVADKLQTTTDFNEAREHARLATHYLLSATDGLKPDHPLIKIVGQLSDSYLDLVGHQL